MQRTVLASIVFLGLGVGLVLGYCHDSTVALGAAYPISGASLQFVINTNGWPVLAGLAATSIGLVLLLVAGIQAVVGEVLSRDSLHRDKLTA